MAKDIKRVPVSAESLRRIRANFVGGVNRPEVTTGPADSIRGRIARKAVGAGGFGFGRERSAGMLLDQMGGATNRGYSSGYALEAYRTSYADGFGFTSGNYDVPTYFVQMNEQNGGVLYWPVTLQEKYGWFRYWARCIFVDDKHLGQVLMADGTVKDIREIQKGEEIITALGTIRPVKWTYKRDCDDNAVIVNAVGCGDIKTTHNHPFWVLRRDKVYEYPSSRHVRKDVKFEPEWVLAEDLEVGDHILRPMDVELKKEPGINGHAAFLGMYCAEGNLIDADGHHEIQLTCNSKELSTIQELMTSVLTDGRKARTYKVHKDGDGWHVKGASKEIFALCDKHVGRGSKTKKLSEDVMALSGENALAFLGAYFSGDGSQTSENFTNKGELVASTSSPHLASQISEMCLRQGMVCRKTKFRQSGKGYGDAWHLTIPRQYTSELLQYTRWKESSRSKFRTGGGSLIVDGFLASRVRSITREQTKGEVYNLEIDAPGTDENSFICNGMAVHNSDAYVGRSLELLADLPMSKLTLNMPKMEGKEKLREEILEFFTWQCEVINLFDLLQSVLWEMNMIGNCLTAETPIMTKDGFVPIVEIREGDIVVDHDGNYSRVVKIMRRQIRERVNRIQLERIPGYSERVTDEHPYFVLRNDREVMVYAKDLIKGDFVAVPKIEVVQDREKVDVFGEMEDILGGYYDTYTMECVGSGYEATVHLRTLVETSCDSAEIKRKIFGWLSSLDGPVEMSCVQVGEVIGVSDIKYLRSVVSNMTRKGQIETVNINCGNDGYVKRWNPISFGSEFRDLVGKEFTRTYKSGIAEFLVDNDFLYVLGYWLGDGWLWHSQAEVREFEGWDIVFSKEATDFLELMFGKAMTVFGNSVSRCVGSFCNDDMNHVVIRDSLFCKWWSENFGSRCGDKKIPSWVMELPPEKLVWLLRGIIDSDGCVSETKSGLVAQVALTNERLVQQLFHVGIKCGYPFCFERSERKESIGPRGVKLPKSVVYVLKIADFRYVRSLTSGCLKARRHEEDATVVRNPSFIEKNGRFYYKVRSKTREHFVGPVYNFEVEGSHTYCSFSSKLHNCFIFHEWDEEKKMWARAVMLPPEEVFVFQFPFSDEKRVDYKPKRLIELIQESDTGGVSDLPQGNDEEEDMQKEIVEHIPEDLEAMVKKNGAIRMDSDPMTGSFVHHVARRRSPYEDLGASVLERVLVPMLQKEHFRYAQLSLASRNMTPKNLITAPNLLPDELDDLRTQVDLSYLDPEYSIISNYEVQWEQIGTSDRLLNLDSEYERIENQVFAAMGVTRELLTGEGAFSGNKITVEILNTMFLLVREALKNYVEKQLFIPICEAHGWYKDGKNGVRHYYYPSLGFNRLTIRDNAEVFDSLYQLYQKGSLPIEVIYELFNLNSDEMDAKLFKQLFKVSDATFNRLAEEVNSETGRALVEKTNIVEKVAKYLDLEITGGGEEEGFGGGFGEGFGQEEEFGQRNESVREEPQEESSQEETSEVDAVVDELTDILPSDASDDEVDEAVEQVTQE